MSNPAILILLIVAAYLAGSVNFSILAFRFTGRDDPRQHGSGNPGATNVYRQAGLAWAVAVLLLDMGRAMAVALLATILLPVWQVPWVGLGLIMGNRWPLFHRLRGGKGVANYLGFTAVIAPAWAGIGALAWGAAHLVWRTPFLSSFAMVFCLAAGTALAPGAGLRGGLGAMATALFIVACHHTNIRQRWGRGKR
jgi:acyl phosphate:glycerol-3-phosphate acyltransferase